MTNERTVLTWAIAFIAAALLAGVGGLEAQVSRTADAWRWVRFVKGSGLPSDRVEDIVEAADGTAWASTANGLAWYDGYQWRPVGLSHGLPDSEVASSLAPDGDHGMLAVFGRRLYRGDTSGFRLVVLERNGARVEVSRAVALKGGDLLVAADEGLLRYTSGRLTAESLRPGAPAGGVQDLRRASAGAIWIAARSGLYRWGGARWNRMSALAPVRFHVAEDDTGRWAAFISSPQGLRGLWEGRGEHAPARTVEGNEASAHDIAPTGEMAIANSTLELRWRSAPGAAWQDLWAPVQRGTVLSLRFRRNGDLWVGTTQGLFLLRRSARLWTDLAHERFDVRNVVNDVLRTRDGAIWIATENGVEVRPGRGPARWITEIGNARLGRVTGLAEDDAGGVWVSSGASFDGAWRWDGAAWRHYGPREGLDAPRVHKIRRDRQGRLWFLGIAGPSESPGRAAHESGAFVLDSGRFTRWGIPQGLPALRVYAFGESPDGALWFGTEAGVSRWKRGVWTRWRPKQRVFTLAVGADNRVWFADQQNGVTFIDAHDQLHDVGVADGLMGLEVWDLRVDSRGWLWAATRSGLAIYHDSAWSWIGPEQGLTSPRLWPVLPLDDRVYIGFTGGGVSMLALDEAREPTPKVQIASSTDADGRVASVSWTVRQFWGLPNADFMETRHRLDGGAWSPWSAQRQVSVDHPSSGRHVVEVQAKGMLGDIGTPARQEFSVPLPLILRPVVTIPAGLALIGLMVLMGMMVTAKRRRDVALRESEERFRSIFGASPLGVSVIDSASGRFNEVNPRFAAIVGWTMAELTGMDWMSITHPDDLQQDLDYMVRMHAMEIPGFAMVKRYRRPDGAFVWVQMTVTRMSVAEGGAMQRLCMIEDITERRHGEAALRLQSAALEATANAIVITDRQGVIEWVNAAFETSSGYRVDEAVGRTPGELLRSGAHDEEFDREMWRTIQSGEVWHGEVVNKRRNGNLFTEDMTITPLRNERGEITHFISVKQDITKEKTLEEQFRQSQKMESVGRLAGGVAHDFNNMLTVILGRAELGLLQTDTTQPIHAHLLEIEEAARRSANLTRQLLAFARLQTITPRVLDLNETVADSLRMLQRLIGENIQLSWQPAPMLWPTRIDPSQMDQILANLCVNVRDAIATVGRLVIATANCRLDAAFCATHAGAVPGEYVVLTVSDTGCGMDAATLTQIFEPFFTTKELGKGTGLGLSMVYGAVKQNGGYVTVASEPGKGTTFEIYLPRYVGEEGPEDASGADAEIPRGDETILLVEDEPVVLELTTEMLEAQGYTVFAASGPAAAIRLAQAHAGEIDLLLTDVMMPEMNGRELANRLLTLLPGLRCLFMSGYSADIIGTHGVLAEETNFLAKPFSLAALADAVRKALRVRGTPPYGAAVTRVMDT